MNLNSLKTRNGADLFWTTSQKDLYFSREFAGEIVGVAVPVTLLEKLTIHQIGDIVSEHMLRLRAGLQAAIELSLSNSSNSTPT